MQKQNDTLVARFWKVIYFLIDPPPEITDFQQKRQARLLSALLLSIILLGGVSGIIQVLIVPGFLATFLAIASAVIALSIAYALTRTKYYWIAAIIAALTPSIASYAGLLTNPKDQSAFVFMLVSVLLSSILLNQGFTIGFSMLNLIGLLILPTLQPAWTFSILAGKISYHIIIPALIVVAMRHRDLVEHDRQKELVESELKFRSIFDNSVDAIGVSRTGIHVTANPAYLRMFGYDSIDQLAGKSILDLIAPSHHPQILDYIHRRAAGDEVPSSCETRGLRRDNSEFDMEVRVSTYGLGGEQYTVPILRDITERRKNYEQIQYQASLLKNVSDAIIASDLNFKIVSWNQAAEALYGWRADEVAGKLVQEIIQTEYLEESAEEVSQKCMKMGFWKGEVIQKHKDGTRLDILTSVSSIVDDDGRPTGTVAVNRDITQRKQTENALRISERRLRFAMEGANDGIWDVQMETGEVYMSPRGCEILGYLSSEMGEVARVWSDLVYPNDLQLTQERLTAHLNEHTPIFEVEQRLRTKSGDWKWVLTRGKLVERDALGKPLRMTGTHTDITERKQAEEALYKSEALYRQAIEVAGAIPYLQSYSSGITGIHYDFIGEGIRQITGYGPEEFDLHLFDSLVEESVLLGELTQYSWEEAIRRVRTGDYPVWKCEHRLRARDGSIHWVFEAAVELYDQTGVSHGSLGMFQDITERKQIQQELEENRRRLAFLLDKSPAVIYSSKATGDFGATFIASNVTSQLGYQPDDFTGNPNFWLEHIHPDDVSRVLAKLHKLFEQGIYAYEYRFLHKIGHYLWMRDEMTLIRTDSGEPLEIIGAWINITERKQAEAERDKLIQELTDKNSELERFTYTVSHDLKSPLVTINGYLGYLEHDAAAGNQERLKKDTQRIQEAVNKMYRLLNELLDLSRIGRVMNSPVRAQFHELVQAAMDVVRGQINARGVVIRVQPHLPVVYVDKPRIIEVLQNLLDNAIRYMGDQAQPQIEIGQRSEQNGQPVLYICDNGMGVAPEYHERIFGLFNKLDAKSEGTGVGLALVKRIIEVHEGRIWIESELGQGSTFLFSLPSKPKPDSVI